MKKRDIQRFLPYEADYNLLDKCRNCEAIGLWGIGACSILLPILNYFSDNFYYQ